jgi:hypothetical protein
MYVYMVIWDDDDDDDDDDSRYIHIEMGDKREQFPSHGQRNMKFGSFHEHFLT